MSARTRLGLFGVALLAVFVLGVLGGTAAGPLDGGPRHHGGAPAMRETGAER